MSGTFVNTTEDFYRKFKDPEMTDEVTLSHMLREKSRFLPSPYGSVIADFLTGKGIRKDPKVLEVGPGTGEFADAFIRKSRVKSYDFLDISGRLLDSLKKRFRGERFGFIETDVLKVSGIGKRYNTVICNEVLADLPSVVNLDPERTPAEDGIIAESMGMIKKYKLRTPGRPFNFNYGAVRFLEEVTNVLEKGGKVLIIENMSDPGYPRSIPVFGHTEFNIRFSWMEKAAEVLGFSTERGKMTELLGVNKKPFLSMFLVPELKIIFDQMNRQGRSKELIERGTLAMTPGELAGFLESSSSVIGIDNMEEYSKRLTGKARDISFVTDQFGYLILRKG